MPINLFKAAFRSRTKKMPSVQALRALAALSVVFGHSLHEASRYFDARLIATLDQQRWGIGVDMFFIISGFIMMYTSSRYFGEPGAPKNFALRRLIRIVPPYWFFTALMVPIAIANPVKLDSTVFKVDHTILSFLFIPHLEPGLDNRIHPLLGQGWTLNYEMFFYAAFALALFFRKWIGLALLVIFFVAVFVMARAHYWSTALNLFWGNSVLFEFLLGIILFLSLKDGQLRWKSIAAITFVCSIIFSVSIALETSERFLTLGMAAFVIVALIFPIKADRLGIMAILVMIGDASYALYLSHPFTIEAIKIFVVKVIGLKVASPLFAPFYVLLCVVLSLIAALAFYALVERPVTEFLHRLITPPRSVATPILQEAIEPAASKENV